jgi:hypothetical protein
MREKTCATCKWWDLPNGGSCRRHAPKAESWRDQWIGVWPLTVSADWCGEHEGAKTDEAE